MTLQRSERNNRRTELFMEFIQNPGFRYVSRGNFKFITGDFWGAIHDFNRALDVPGNILNSSTSAFQLRVNTLVRRACCFFNLGVLDKSLRDSSKAFNISEEMGFQEGVSDIIQLMTRTYERIGDIRSAFQRAVLLKTVDLKTARAHVGRLREKLELIFLEDVTLVDELRDNLMSTGIDLFTKERFKEAVEYFTEVVRLVCKFQFLPQAYLYKAKCHVNLDDYENARDSCVAVLQQDPENEEGKNILQSVNVFFTQQNGNKNAKKRKATKKKSNPPVPVEVKNPDKKPVMNKKQRKHEEHRRMKDAEKIIDDIKERIEKDREKQQRQQQTRKTTEMENAKPLPSYDLKAAWDASGSGRKPSDQQTSVKAVGGARPKQYNNKQGKANNRTKPVLDRNNAKKQHTGASCNESDNITSKRGSSKHSNMPSLNKTSPRGTVSDQNWSPINVDNSFDARDSNSNQVNVSSERNDGWTVVTSKRHQSMSLGEKQKQKPSFTGPKRNSSRCHWSPSWPSLPGPSYAEDTNRSNEIVSDDRVEVRSDRSVKENPNEETSFDTLGLADHRSYFQQSGTLLNRDESVSAGLAASRLLDYSIQPRPHTVATNKRVSIGKTPTSQWESLEQISPLQIHHDLELGSSTERSKRMRSTPRVETTTELPNFGNCSSRGTFADKLPNGVVHLCDHVLQDRKTPTQPPYMCSNCSKKSKFKYGIWRRSKREWQLMRPCPKSVKPGIPFKICLHYANGRNCQRSCTFAHGEEELTLWTEERQAVRVSSGNIPNPGCLQEDHDFDMNRKPQQRIQGSLKIHDERQIKPRPPPSGVYRGNFKLCNWWKSHRICRTGRFCTFAHGNDELNSWINWAKEEHKNSLSECVEESPRQKEDKCALVSKNEMVYSLPGVEVSSDKPSTVKIFHCGDERRHVYKWVFSITFELSEVGVLRQIDLLHRYHDCYRLTKVQGFLSDVEKFSKVPTGRWLFRLPSWFTMKEGKMRVDVSVSFESKTSDGTFTQCLQFDFGKTPCLLHGLNVDVASEEVLNTISVTREKLKLDTRVWTHGSMEVVVSPRATAVTGYPRDEELQKRYKLPPRIENIVSAQVMEVNITTENYHRVMHQLLFTEELFMKKAISSFVIQNGPLQCQRSYSSSGMTFAGYGELFGVLTFQENGTPQPDDASGRLLVRNVQTAWLKLAGSSSQKVYEAFVEKVESTRVVLRLSSQICSDLQLTDTGQISVDVQFQLNRQPLCEWHAAIDRLGAIHRSLLFPRQPNASQATYEETPSWSCLPSDRGNAEQEEVIRRILVPESNSPPLVVFGPFGTGKTYTLHQAIRRLVTKRNNRILLCTHTNSAADLHVKLLHEYLTKHKGLKAATPLRIYHTWRRLDADSSVAKKYASIENNAYVLPTREKVIKHRVVITTLATSKHLLQLQLNHGIFTHILVDEAAQALEPEALTPLVLAGPNTKVVFTGDHMQMKPEVYSHFAREWGLQRSLPERLFDHYHQTEKELESNVIFLTKNYRCHPDILQFPSDNFYGGEEGKGLIACSEEAAHPRLGPLLFFTAHGVEEALENSYTNITEAKEVAKRVKELSDDWPIVWGEKDLSKIGVISAYMTQVRTIRTLLRREGAELANVTVESIHNVQGKEFRAVFISTVRTSLTCQSFHGRDVGCESQQLLYWEFFSDSTLLNTAITRAKSLVAVIGDPVSLCTVGDCRGNWRDYIRRCNDHKALYGISYEELKKQISASLLNISLNPKAANFVPRSMTEVSNQEPIADCSSLTGKERDNSSRFEGTKDEELDGPASPIQERHNNPMTMNVPEPGMYEEDLMQEESSEEDEDEQEEQLVEDEQQSVRSSQGANQEEVDNTTSQSAQEEEDNGQDTSSFFDEFCRESLDDETVFPRYMDKIIKALLEKCKTTKANEARLRESSEIEAFPPLQAAKMSQTKRSKRNRHVKKQAWQESSFSDLPSVDYQIYNVNGRKIARLVNLGFNATQPRRERKLTASSRQHDFLEPEMLHRNLLADPKKYLSCTLRLSSEIIHMAYAVVSDTKTPDIKVKGRIRAAFDMDRVVIKKTTNSEDFLGSQGYIVGVLNHIISPHERQYVCRVDYENPELMLPINKSVSRIMTLTAKNDCMPIYKEIRDGNETIMKIDEMNLSEFCSGNYLFLVQYLQWRPDCTHPLGIIVRKLPQKHTLDASMRILFAEHGVGKSFGGESKNQVRNKFPPSWSIPAEEYKNREKIDGAFTIDPATSKDLDDALTLEQLSDNVFRIGVHIADVTYFVEAGSPLDKEALFRCTSYYPGHSYESVPMLPRELSENHCSLLPGKDRLSLSVFLEVTEEGKLIGQPQIKRTIVVSSCKLSYLDAQRIIDGQQCVLQQIPQDTARKIQSLSFLAQRRRVSRLRDAAFDHWSDSDYDPENFKAHEMVEEMMILANEQVANFLSAQSKDEAPLRTQLPPKDHILSDWVRQYGQYIKYSLFLRGFYSKNTLEKMSEDATGSNAGEFKVQESIWSEICHAAISDDQAKLQFLICNESHHPQLAVANSRFQRIRPKSQYVCEGDQPEENIIHFSLGLRCYTHFTSPIRRYVDIQVHRLVLNLISQGGTTKKPSKDQVDKVCRRSTFAQDNSRKFDKGCSKVHLAVKLKQRNHETKAVIALIEKQAISLEILNQEYNHLSTPQKRIKLSNLNPFKVEVDQDGSEVVFTWKPRLYIAPKAGILVDVKHENEEVNKLLSQGMGGKGKVLNLPADNWQQILKELQEGNLKKLSTLITKTDADLERRSRQAMAGSSRERREKATNETNMGHFYDKRLCLKTFDVVNIQLTARMTHGTLHPEVQLFKINPAVHVCIEHQKYARECFATTARYQASQERYCSVDNYIKAWKPVLAMEAATGAVDESDEFTIHHLKVQWTKKETSGDIEGSFRLLQEYCTSRQIEFFKGDFVCVRVREDEYMTHLGPSLACPEKTTTELNVTQPERTSSSERWSSRHKSGDELPSFWVGHCIIKDVHKSEKQNSLVVTMDFHQSSSVFPEELLTRGSHPSILTVIHRSLVHRRMFAALCSLENASQFVHDICMGHDTPSQEDFGNLPFSNLSIVNEHPTCGLKPLNQYQDAAVREALVKPLTLVQGPPGTGKTVTGVHMAYWFTKRNMPLQPQEECAELPKAPPLVIYCGPSNKSVDVVAYKMLRIPDLKIIRVYSDRKEEMEFPIPNRRKPLKNSTDDENQILDEELKAVSLHHVIRGAECPFASELRAYELKFDADKKGGVRTSVEVDKYCDLIGNAEKWALESTGVQIILCTCAVAGSPRIVSSCKNRIKQCIVDECGMCLELESLVPITCSEAPQVVLIGDHKQLQPVIQDHVAKTLGLSVSMFERLSERAMMLELQYRMHEGICRFPSKYFYDGKLKTDPTVATNRDPLFQSFWPAHELQLENTLPIAFCHVEGEEESSAIKTSQSNENSKANMKEVGKVVHVARCLVQKKGVHPKDVVILSPYREQRSRISDALKTVHKCKDILVTTITKSQGSEWDYVIISLVRSLKKDEIDPDPSLKWLREHLGFVTDEHQMNVGLTRARKGLCIIGNKNLLKHHTMWQSLLDFYEENHCLVNESNWPSN